MVWKELKKRSLKAGFTYTDKRLGSLTKIWKINKSIIDSRMMSLCQSVHLNEAKYLVDR